MVLKLILGMLLVSQLYAQTKHHDKCNHNSDGVINCLNTNDHDEKKDLASKYLEWWAASNIQVKNAYCNNPGIPTNEEMTKFLKQKSIPRKVSAVVAGIKLEGEDPHMVDLLAKLTKWDPMFNFNKEDALGQKKFSVPTTCKKVLCAAESIFGKAKALKMLYALDKYEINMSSLTDKNLASWKSSEIDIILEAVDDLPSHLVPFNKNQSLKHYKRGYGPSSSTVANAVITVFSVWEDNLDNDQERMSALIHEIGHNIGHRLDQDESPEWLDISGWEQKEDVWTPSLKDQVVSKYGLTNPAEDFAETFVAFRYNPQLLKKMSPKKYNYMRDKVFSGLEYDSAEKCKDKNSNFTKLLNEIKIKDAPPPNNFGLCEAEIEQILLKKDVDLKACINRIKLKTELDKKIAEKSEVEKNTIRNAIKFKEINGVGVTKGEERTAYKRIIGDIYGSLAQDFDNYSGTDCASSKKYGWQDFLSFNQYAFKDKYHGIATQEDLNKISYKICKDLRGPRTLKCSDLRPYMNAHIPKRLWPDYSDIKQQELNHFVAVSDNTRVNLPQLDRFQIEKKLEINNKDLNNFRCSF